MSAFMTAVGVLATAILFLFLCLMLVVGAVLAAGIVNMVHELYAADDQPEPGPHTRWRRPAYPYKGRTPKRTENNHNGQ